KQLAQKSGLPESAISEARNDKRTLRSDSLVKLCEALDVSADYLLGLSETKSFDVDIKTVQKATGIDEVAAFKLVKNAGGYYQALSAILESDTFWKFLILMETYKSSGSGDELGSFIESRIINAAKSLLPDSQKKDVEMFKEEYFKAICNRYVWELMEGYKKRRSE
ncbi:MAG: helix-turn-helix domain-containing protein, partial [Anaerotignum sp.]